MAHTKALYILTLFAIFLINSRACFCEIKSQSHSVENFFDIVDQDGDGQIEQHEATQFMASFAEDSATSETTGDNFISHSFNFSYGGNTISFEEMLDHLQNMLTTDHVIEWIKHGLQLPQYADAFKSKSVNGFDFPSLIENGSWTLATEIGVSSPMHRKKITYAIVRQIFGFGAPPGPPRNVKCNPLMTVGIQLQWNPPKFLGYPPLHKYVISRWEMSSSAWTPVSETKEHHFLDRNIQADVIYSYRIQGWGGHGSSELVTLNQCNISRSSRCDSFTSIINAADKVNSHSSNSLSPKDHRKHELNAMTGASSFWAWIFSVNSGLLLLGILSRQSFLFRVSLAAWVLFKIHVLHKIHLAVLQARFSNYGLLRALSHALIFVIACCTYTRAKICFLSRQGISFRSSLGSFSSSDNGNKFLTRTGTFQDAIGYSVASCTLDEMLEAIKKQEFSVKPIRSNGRMSQKANGISTCDSSDEVFLPADKNFREFSDELGKGPMQRVPAGENLPCSNLSDAVLHIKKQAKSSGTIYTNEEEESITSSSQVIVPLESRCLSAPASVERFSSSASDSERDQSGNGEGCPEKLNDEIHKQKPRVLLGSFRRTRSRCNQEGCRVRFDRWHSLSDWHMRFSRHYCHECQGVFCIQHTRIAPHGRHGQCGFDSNCYCTECFQGLPKDVQKELESLNKLHSNSMKKESPPTLKLFRHNHNSKSGTYQSSNRSLDDKLLEFPGSTSANSTNVNSRNSAAQDEASVSGQRIFPLRFSKSTKKASINKSPLDNSSNANGTGSTALSNDA